MKLSIFDIACIEAYRIGKVKISVSRETNRISDRIIEIDTISIR